MNKTQVARMLARQKQQERAKKDIDIDKPSKETTKQIADLAKAFKAYTNPKGGDIAKPIAPYELQEQIEDNVHKLIGVYEGEIFKLKCKLEEIENGAGTRLFTNTNGFKYLILAEQGNNALLAQIDCKQFVVAYGLDWECKAWQGASYWDNLDGAYTRYKERIQEEG